jgi:asparagine synthase (glutamine-hydrolysing)
LSGGVDSTTVTALLARQAGRPVSAFSIGFAERYFNEMDFARVAAKAAGVTHHEYYVTPDDAFEAVPIVLDSFDEPFANASAIPTYFCARLAREHGVNVLYAGDAGDELFAGNERYASRRVFDHYDRVPRFLRDGLLTPGIELLAKGVPGPFFRRARNYVRQASLPYPERITSFSVFNYIPLRTLFTEDLLQSAGAWSPGDDVARHYRAARAHDVLDRELYIDLKLSISDNDLFKVTRMTHAAGIAVRFPFLDRDLAEFSATVPARIKMRGGRLRSFFKDAYRDVLPPEVSTKKKHGFGLPIAMWLETHPPFREMIGDLLLSPRALNRGYFRRDGVEALLRGHRNDPKGFYGTFLWNMMTLEMWHRRFLP